MDQMKGVTVFQYGKELRQMRESAGLTQTEVAKRFGYTTSQVISNFERGICAPPLGACKKLEKLYQVAPESIRNLVMADKVRKLREKFEAKAKRRGM